jgi:hypothetical protein
MTKSSNGVEKYKDDQVIKGSRKNTKMIKSSKGVEKIQR